MMDSHVQSVPNGTTTANNWSDGKDMLAMTATLRNRCMC